MKRDTLWSHAKKNTTSGFGLFPESAESTVGSDSNRIELERASRSVLVDGN